LKVVVLNWIFSEICAMQTDILVVKIFFKGANIIMTALIQVSCPNCGSEKVVRRGKRKKRGLSENVRTQSSSN